MAKYALGILAIAPVEAGLQLPALLHHGREPSRIGGTCDLLLNILASGLFQGVKGQVAFVVVQFA